jgi:hypothetical protein
VTIFGANAIAIFKKIKSGRTQMHLYGNSSHPREGMGNLVENLGIALHTRGEIGVT